MEEQGDWLVKPKKKINPERRKRILGVSFAAAFVVISTGVIYMTKNIISADTEITWAAVTVGVNNILPDAEADYVKLMGANNHRCQDVEVDIKGKDMIDPKNKINTNAVFINVYRNLIGDAILKANDGNVIVTTTAKYTTWVKTCADLATANKPEDQTKIQTCKTNIAKTFLYETLADKCSSITTQ